MFEIGRSDSSNPTLLFRSQLVIIAPNAIKIVAAHTDSNFLSLIVVPLLVVSLLSIFPSYQNSI